MDGLHIEVTNWRSCKYIYSTHFRSYDASTNTGPRLSRVVSLYEGLCMLVLTKIIYPANNWVVKLKVSSGRKVVGNVIWGVMESQVGSTKRPWHYSSLVVHKLSTTLGWLEYIRGIGVLTVSVVQAFDGVSMPVTSVEDVEKYCNNFVFFHVISSSGIQFWAFA